jgi:hypothetical protein
MVVCNALEDVTDHLARDQIRSRPLYVGLQGPDLLPSEERKATASGPVDGSECKPRSGRSRRPTREADAGISRRRRVAKGAAKGPESITAVELKIAKDCEAEFFHHNLVDFSRLPEGRKVC